MTRAQQAKENFLHGLNCSQAVVMAFADLLDVPEETLKAALLPLVTVFLYRRRLLQIRLCVAEMVLLVGSAVMEGIYYYLGSRVVSELSFSTHGVGISIVLPVVSLLFAWLASRAIFRDEVLVRSVDRIR